MSLSKYIVSAAALSLLLGTAAVAQTDVPGTSNGCLQMKTKVSAALDANQQSPNYDAAKAKARGAQNLCSMGLYKVGVDGYAEALKILGVN